MGARRRLDTELVRRGLTSSREKAQEAISSGRVTVGGAPAPRPSRLVGPGEPVELLGPPPRFVSRGGDKLDAALEHFGIDVAGHVALDAGSSTGGFTDCLLQRGAARVTAVDVGRGQSHPRIRNDHRVEVLERTDIRRLGPAQIETYQFSLVVADLSFISLTSVLPNLVSLAEPGADMVLLVKPQFEAGRAEVSRGKGVIRDPEIWARVLAQVGVAMSAAQTAMMGLMISPLRGAEGNVEFFVHSRAHQSKASDIDVAGVIAGLDVDDRPRPGQG